MEATVAAIEPGRLAGTAAVPPSKSAAHRAVVCAALAAGTSHIGNVEFSQDILATLGAAQQLGAKVERGGHELTITGRGNADGFATITRPVFCNESGSTLRFILPLFSLTAQKVRFTGAGRRFEVYGECNGALVIDDYAHHPTELRATLNTAKEMGYKRLIAVHQPFTYSRTKMLFNDFVDVLKIPDITVLTPIMGSREPNDPTITSAKLAAQIPNSVLVDSLEAAADWVKQNAREGDLVITLGCGDIYKASKMMVKKD